MQNIRNIYHEEVNQTTQKSSSEEREAEKEGKGRAGGGGGNEDRKKIGWNGKNRGKEKLDP